MLNASSNLAPTVTPKVPSAMGGRLEVICGPMFAGKSTELIRRLREGQHAGMNAVAFKPASDTRSGESSIRTHPGDVLDAHPLADASGLIGALPSDVALDQLAIGVDEGHFFGTALIEPVRILIARGARLVIAGIERDHRGLPFEPFPILLCEADEVTKLTSTCAVCGGAAVHSQRMFTSDVAIVVGGAESYQARCRACFQPG